MVHSFQVNSRLWDERKGTGVYSYKTEQNDTKFEGLPTTVRTSARTRTECCVAGNNFNVGEKAGGSFNSLGFQMKQRRLLPPYLSAAGI